MRFVEGALALAATPAAAVRLGARTIAAAPVFASVAMSEDLRTFANGLEEVGAEPFRTSSREAFTAALARAEAFCAQPRTRR